MATLFASDINSRERHNGLNTARKGNYISFAGYKKCKLFEDISFFWDVDEYTIKESQTLCDITH